MASILEGALHLAFPRRAVCLGCGSWTGCREDWVCERCREALTALWVGEDLPPEGIDAAGFAYEYRAPAANLVRQLKYRGLTKLAPFMAADMVKACHFLGAGDVDGVVAVPMHRDRLRRRGYNQAELLAENIADRLSVECIDALFCVRRVEQQAKLGGEARRRNLRGAIAPKMSLPGRRLMLVDDVRTTGATAQTCAQALKAAGAQRVYLACYAVARGDDAVLHNEKLKMENGK